MRIGRQGAGWFGCGKEAGAARKNGRIRGLEKKELKTERGSVFYWIEKKCGTRGKMHRIHPWADCQSFHV